MKRARAQTRLCHAVALGFWLVACQKTPARITRPGPVETRQDPQLGMRDLERDLEATILDTYLQLTLGNMETYADGIARNRDVVLLGIAPEDVIQGLNPSNLTDDRRPFPELALPRCGSAPTPPAARPADARGETGETGESSEASSESGEASGKNGETVAKLDAQQGTGPRATGPRATGNETGAAAGEGAPGNESSDAPVDLPRCARLLSKLLELHLYRDGSVAWVADEIDYRLAHNGREASIPLQYTAVVVRDIDRWVIVMEHTSHAMPLRRLLGMAGDGSLAKPGKLTTRRDERGRARLLRSLVTKQLNNDSNATALYARKMTERYTQAVPAGGSPYRLPQSIYLVLWSYRGGEYHGPQTFDAPSLAEILRGESRAGTDIVIESYRLSFADNRQVAWMAATLRVKLTQVDPNGGPGRAIDFRLRGTFVFATDASGWNLVQSHVSAPISDEQLATSVFGPALPAGPVTPVPPPGASDRGGTQKASAEPKSQPKAKP